MSQDVPFAPHPAPARTSQGLPDRLLIVLRRFGNWLAAAQARQRQRRRLAELDDRALADIGLSRAEARFEAEKPFWLP
jgi:uncharacterized protein YjiS (DUF1127 family)